MNTNSFSNSYKEAGVDVTAGYKAVELMKQHVARTMTSGVLSGIGGFDLAAAWAGWTIKAYGNAIVPQVALRIFETINEYEKQ